MIAHIVITGEHAHIRAPFQVKEVIKGVPGRRWDKPTKCWIVSKDFAHDLAGALRAAGCITTITDNLGRPWPPPAQRTTPTTSWAVNLLRAVGPTHADKVFAALAKILHPDVGGDAALMRDLINARDTLRRSA